MTSKEHEVPVSPDTKLAIQRIGRLIKEATGPGVAFAAFLGTHVEEGLAVVYVSNAERQDVLKVLQDWLSRLTTQPSNASPDSPDQDKARLAFEAKYVDLGKTIAEAVPVAIFFATMGEGGYVAWYIDLPNAKARIENWIARQKQLS